MKLYYKGKTNAYVLLTLYLRECQKIFLLFLNEKREETSYYDHVNEPLDDPHI